MKISLLTGIAPENKLLERLKGEIKDARKIFMAVSFIQEAGLKYLISCLKPLINNNEIKIYTSGYLNITDPEALQNLLKLSNSFKNIKVFFNPNDRFHSKFIFIEKEKNNYSLFLGSSNISVGGLQEIGELNVLLKGKKGDEIFKDIKIVIDNFEKDKNFKEIAEDIVNEYKEMFKKLSKKRKKFEISGKASLKKMDKTKIIKEKMPIYVAEREYTDEEIKKIEEKHPKWKNYVDFTGNLKKLKIKKGEYFLLISDIPKQKEAQICKFLEYDRISNLGNIAHIEQGKSLPLEELEKYLKTNFRQLKSKEFLDIYDIAILKKHFADYWPK